MTIFDHSTNPYFTTTQNAWLRSSLHKNGLRAQQVCALAEHADTRRYLRIFCRNTSIICLQTRGNHDLATFIATSKDLAEKNIPVPHIIDHNTSLGLALISDLGDLTLRKAILKNPTQSFFLYEKAVTLMQQLQNTQPKKLKPHYTSQRAQDNMMLCVQWYCEKLCQSPLTPVEKSTWQRVTAQIGHLWDEIPVGVCHRDFHADNLMVTTGKLGNQLHILDYQDLSTGPFLYDLASLVTDHYQPAEKKKKSHLFKMYFKSLQQKTNSYTQNQDWLHLLCYQRNIKNLGVFARLALTQNKYHFLDNIPRMFANMRKIAIPEQSYDELIDMLWQKFPQNRKRSIKF